MSNKKKEQDKKIKVLVWGDSPAAATGFATVVRNIFNGLESTGKYEIDIIGINDRGGWKDPEKYPYKIFPARSSVDTSGDFHGRGKFVSSIFGKDKDLKAPWDIVFTLNDPFVLEQGLAVFDKGTMSVIEEAQRVYREKLKSEYHFKTISYWPVDSSLKGNWVRDAIALPDYSVAYTEYGKEQILDANRKMADPLDIEDKLRVIYHGVNLKDFFPISEEDRKEFRSTFFEGVVKEQTFVVSAVARNQRRKDLPRTFAIFKEFQKRRPESFLYLHAQETDQWGSLREYASHWNLEFGKDWGVPNNFDANTGFPIEGVNLIYNASDAIISTTHGEGWGFYNTEAFATKTPVIAPNNTVHPEIFGYDGDDDISDPEELFNSGVRGMPYMCGEGLSDWCTYGPEDMERVRPVGDVQDAVKKLVWVYDNPDKAKEMADRGHKWAQQLTWKNICKQWDDLFMEAYNKLEGERSEFNKKSAEKKANKAKKKKERKKERQNKRK